MASVLALAVSVLVLAFIRSDFGRVNEAIRVNEFRAELLGYDVRLRRVLTFMVSGAIAGLAGGGYAAWGSFVSPSVFSLQQAALVAIWVLVGGKRSVPGAFVGVAIVQTISSSSAGSAEFTPIVLGAILIAVIFFLPDGVMSGVVALKDVVARRLQRRGTAEVAELPPRPAHAPTFVSEPAAKAVKIARVQHAFGGLKVLRGVDISVKEGTLHCIVGPNGAGKSTLFNVVIGRHKADQGTIFLGDDEITRAHPHLRARRGLGIKLQVPSVFTELTVRENVWLAARRQGRRRPEVRRLVDETLAWLDLGHRAVDRVDVLSHGDIQRLEIGMVLAGRPSVLLLDEPTAGMTASETRQMAEMLIDLVPQVTVLVVEHDMEFIRLLDSPVTVLHQGEVFASGSIAELQQNEDVMDIYLGRGGTHAQS